MPDPTGTGAEERRAIPSDLQDQIDALLEQAHGPTENAVRVGMDWAGYSEAAAGEATRTIASAVEKARDAGLVSGDGVFVLTGLCHSMFLSGLLLGISEQSVEGQ